MPTIADVFNGTVGMPRPRLRQPDFSIADPAPEELNPPEPPPPGMNEFGQMTIPSFPMSQRAKDQEAIETAASKWRLSNQGRDPEDRGVAYDLARAVTGSPAIGELAGLFAPRPPQSGLDFAVPQLGTFAGRMAKTANLKALAKAEKMDVAGRLKHEIMDQTGWFKDADGKWRFEISDDASRIDSKGAMDKRVAAHNLDYEESELASILAHRAAAKNLPIDEAAMHLTNELQRPIPARSIALAKANSKEDLFARAKYLEGYDPTAAPLTVDEVVHHPELKAAYPNLFTRPYERLGGVEALGIHGAYSPSDDKFFFSKFSNEPEWGTGLHELQHGIQAREGFAPGANSGDWSPAAKLKYWNSAGEVESRNVELRKKLTAAERKIKFPWMTQDVKPNAVFVSPPDPFRPQPKMGGDLGDVFASIQASKIPSRIEDINPNAKVELGQVFRGVEGTAKDPLLAARHFKGGDLGDGIYMTQQEWLAKEYGGGPKARIKDGTRIVHEYDINPLFPEDVVYVFGGADGGETRFVSGNGIELWRGNWRGSGMGSGRSNPDVEKALSGVKVVIGTPDSIGHNQVSIRDRSILTPKKATP